MFALLVQDASMADALVELTETLQNPPTLPPGR